MSEPQQWEGLWQLWTGIKRLLAVGMLGAVGALVGLTVGALATFYCYGVGYLVGLPVGFAWGALAGIRKPPRDIAILFFGCFGTLILMALFGERQGWDGFVTMIAALFSATMVTAILSAFLRAVWLTPQARYRLALVLSWAFSIWMIVLMLRGLYSK